MLTGFQTGRQVDVFTTDFDSNTLIWTLTGPDGSTRTATASIDNAEDNDNQDNDNNDDIVDTGDEETPLGTSLPDTGGKLPIANYILGLILVVGGMD